MWSCCLCRCQVQTGWFPPKLPVLLSDGQRLSEGLTRPLPASLRWTHRYGTGEGRDTWVYEFTKTRQILYLYKHVASCCSTGTFYVSWPWHWVILNVHTNSYQLLHFATQIETQVLQQNLFCGEKHWVLSVTVMDDVCVLRLIFLLRKHTYTRDTDYSIDNQKLLVSYRCTMFFVLFWKQWWWTVKHYWRLTLWHIEESKI